MQEGFQWTAYGLSFCFKDSGDLVISRDASVLTVAESLHLYNPHGAIIFDDDLEFDHLSLNTPKVVQTKTLKARSMALQGHTTYINQHYLCVEELIFDDILCDPSDPARLPRLINERFFVGTKPTFINGNGVFINTETASFEILSTLHLNQHTFINQGAVIVHDETTLALTHALKNNGIMTFESDVHVKGKFVFENASSSKEEEGPKGVFVKENIHFDGFKGAIKNKGAFRAQTMRGEFSKLDNAGTFGSEAGFKNLTIGRMHNTSEGRIVSDGHLTVGKVINEGILQAKDLVLGVADTFLNKEEGIVHIRTLRLSPQVKIATNEGIIETEHFDNTGLLFVNKRHLRTKRWDQHGKTFLNEHGSVFAVSEAADMDTLLLTNHGEIFFGENLRGRIVQIENYGAIQGKLAQLDGHTFLNAGSFRTEDGTTFNGSHFNNTGEFTSQGRIQGSIDTIETTKSFQSADQIDLTGKTMTMRGIVKAQQGVRYNGETLITDQDTNLHTTTLHLTTATPLLLKGVFVINEEGLLSAPLIENSAHFTGAKGKTTIQGEFTNSGTMDLDQLVYDHKTLANTGTLEANQWTTATTLDHVQNDGTLTVRQGGFTARKIHNQGTLELNKGLYQFHEWKNKGGSAYIDQLSLIGTVHTLDGRLEVGRFNRPQRSYGYISIYAPTIIHSGGFDTAALGSLSTLSLENGTYNIGKVTNYSDGKLVLQEGACVTLTELTNTGIVQAATDVLLNFQRSSTSEESAMNTPSIAPYFSPPKGTSVTIIQNVTDSEAPFAKFGKFQTHGNLTVRAAYPDADWMDAFLFSHRKNIQIGGGQLTIEMKRFVTRQAFVRPQNVRADDTSPYDALPFHVHFKVDEFVNHRIFTAKGMTFSKVKHFQNGLDNDHMGKIACYGAFDVDSLGVFDNRFGMIDVLGDARIKSIGEILNGYFIYELVQKPEIISTIDVPVYDEVIIDEIQKKRNGSKITSAKKLIIQTEKGVINNYGLLYGMQEADIHSSNFIHNQTGLIYSSSNILITANELLNIIGPIMKGIPKNQYLISEVFYFESGSGEIRTTGGNISLNITQGSNLGSFIESPQSIYINSQKIDQSSPIPGCFSNENASVKISKLHPEYFFGDHWTYTRETVPGFIKSGSIISLSKNLFTLSGNINAPVVTINADIINAIGARNIRRDHTTGNYIVDLGGFARTLAQNNPLLIEDRGTLRANLLGGEDVLDIDPHLLFSTDPFSTLRPSLSSFAMSYASMSLSGTHLGTLNVYGFSGRALENHYNATGKRIQNELIQRGHTANSDSIAQFLQSFNDGFTYWEPKYIGGHIVQNPYRVITQDEIVRAALNYSGITGQRVTINGKLQAQSTIIGTYEAAQPTPIDNNIISSTQKEKPRKKLITEPVKIDLDLRRSLEDKDPSSILNALKKPEKPSLVITGPRVDLTDVSLFSPDDILVSGKEGVSLMADVTTHATADGFNQQAHSTQVECPGNLTVTTDGDVDIQALQIKTGSALIDAANAIREHELKLHSARTRTEAMKDGFSTIHEQWSHSVVSSYDVKDGLTMHSGDRIDLIAPKIRAKLFRLIAQSGVTIHDTMDSYLCQTEQHVQGKGWFGKDKEIYTAYQSIRSKGIDAGDTPVEIILGEKGDVELTNANIKDLVIDPKGGTIRFKLGKNYESFQRSEKSSSAFVQSQSMFAAEHQTASQSNIGAIKVITTEDTPVTIMIEQVRGQTAKFLKHIEMSHGHITQEFWQEVHREMQQSASGITPTCGALIAIAMGAVTFGTGAALSVGTSMANSLGAATGLTATFSGTCMAGAGTAMFAAGFTSLCTSAAISFANNGFDPAKSAKAFASVDTLRSTGMSMLLAGMTHGVLQKCDLATDISKLSTIEDFAANHLVNMVVKTSTDLAFTKKTDGVASTLSAIAGTVGGYVAHQIGTWYKGAEATAINAIAHKIFHGLKGFGEGAIIGAASDNKAEILGKAIAGATGAFVAETTADILTPTGGLGNNGYDPVRIRQTQAAARAVTAAIAFAMGMSADDIGMAVFSANTSLDHNFGGSKKPAIEEPKDGYNTDDEAEASTVGKSRRAVLKAIGIEKIGHIIDNFAHELGLDQSLQAAANYPSCVEGGESEYIAAHLKWTEESVFKRPLTADETAVFSATFKHAYMKNEQNIDVAKAFGTAASVIGKGVDIFLRYTGLTDKGTARAIGNSVNDGLAVAGAGALVKGALKGATKSLGKSGIKANTAHIRSANSADALRLRTELTFQEAGLLDQSGRLTERALLDSRHIDLKGGIKNQQIIDTLTKDGSLITEWSKYKTPSVQAPNGQSLQIHYYKNNVTGAIDYVTPDFKVKGTVNP